MPLITRRSSTRALPRVSVGRCGLIFENCAFVSQNWSRLIYASFSEAVNHATTFVPTLLWVQTLSLRTISREIFDGLGPRGHRGGVQSKSEDQPHGKQLAHAPQPEMRSAGEEREALPVPTDEERPLPDARGEVTGTAEGE